MRRLKFRAWDTRWERMEYFDSLYWFEENGVEYYTDSSGFIISSSIYSDKYNAIVQQFTGIKDSSGRSIYEGDLIDFEVMVNYKEYEMLHNQEVMYDEELAMFVFGEDKWCMADHIKHETIKMVGNIYERNAEQST